MLEIGDINVSYGKAPVLWDITFDLEDKSCVSLIGPNGGGKSTLLKTILGILTPDSGEIKYQDEDITELKPYQIVRKGIVMVPEERELFPSLTVWENLDLAAQTDELRSKKDENMDRVFELFPILKERKSQEARNLSGGQRQMLAIGRGMMLDPSILLLDEPSLGLAPQLVDNVYQTLEKLKKETTMLIAEQKVEKVLNFSERALLISEGKVAKEGKSKKMLKDKEIKKFYLGKKK